MTRYLSLAGLSAALMATTAQAQEGLEIIGKPVDGGTGFQPAVTELASDLQWLDGMILIIITVICLFVVGLLGWVIVRYNATRNPEPASFTHHTPVEIAWTVVPILILVFIGAFSLPVLFKQQEIPEGDITIKVTGYQWYWGYEYIDEGIEFDSYMLGSPATLSEADRPEDANVTPFILDEHMEAKLVDAGYSRDEFLLATDTSVVVPVGKTIVMQVTAADVIHAWTIPSFGVKQDAVPGRLAELWFEAEREGVYFGQCSELCGFYHAYMPITVKVVSEEAYAAWLLEAKEQYASVRGTRVLASN